MGLVKNRESWHVFTATCSDQEEGDKILILEHLVHGFSLDQSPPNLKG